MFSHTARWYDTIYRVMQGDGAEGLDLDDNLLAIARQRLPDVPLHHADMMEATFPRLIQRYTEQYTGPG